MKPLFSPKFMMACRLSDKLNVDFAITITLCVAFKNSFYFNSLIYILQKIKGDAGKPIA